LNITLDIYLKIESIRKNSRVVIIFGLDSRQLGRRHGSTPRDAIATDEFPNF
jgi:hypothetical protein